MDDLYVVSGGYSRFYVFMYFFLWIVSSGPSRVQKCLVIAATGICARVYLFLLATVIAVSGHDTQRPWCDHHLYTSYHRDIAYTMSLLLSESYCVLSARTDATLYNRMQLRGDWWPQKINYVKQRRWQVLLPQWPIIIIIIIRRLNEIWDGQRKDRATF